METSKIKLNSGDEMPCLGLGTYQSTDEKEVTEVVLLAIKLGYRHIDSAYLYNNEEVIGKALKIAIAEGGVKREDMFVVTKLWCSDHDPQHVEAACRRSLSNFGLEYLDLYLIHWPVAYKYTEDRPNLKTLKPDIDDSQDLLGTWKAMEELVEKKLVRNIGISNFNSKQVDMIVKNCKIRPATNQVECHPYLSQHKLKAFCEDRGIPLTAYSPLGAPARPSSGQSNHKVLLEDPILAEIGKKYDKTAAQVALKWQVQRGVIAIPKSVTSSRIEANGHLADFELSKEDMEAVNGLDCNLRYIAPTAFFKPSKNYPFDDEF